MSEKPIDALLSWTMPIYWGCPNVSEYLPEGSYHHIKDIDDFKSIEQVIDIIKNTTDRGKHFSHVKSKRFNIGQV